MSPSIVELKAQTERAVQLGGLIQGYADQFNKMENKQKEIDSQLKHQHDSIAALHSSVNLILHKLFGTNPTNQDTLQAPPGHLQIPLPTTQPTSAQAEGGESL